MHEIHEFIPDWNSWQAHYLIPSCFDETEYNHFKGPKVGLSGYNHGWIGERNPTNSVATDGPGPGSYDIRKYDGIGTDLVAIGAATRELLGTSATEAVHNKIDAEKAVKPVLNYSAMNKAVEELKKTLGELFENVYDAFSFFDIDGGSGPEKSAHSSPTFLLLL